jgi:hypothetical protein
LGFEIQCDEHSHELSAASGFSELQMWVNRLLSPLADVHQPKLSRFSTAANGQERPSCDKKVWIETKYPFLSDNPDVTAGFAESCKGG